MGKKKKREFLSEAKLKISRLQVAQILYQLEKKCTSNEKLQRLWDKMNGEFEKYYSKDKVAVS